MSDFRPAVHAWYKPGTYLTDLTGERCGGPIIPMDSIISPQDYCAAHGDNDLHSQERGVEIGLIVGEHPEKAALRAEAHVDEMSLCEG